MTCVVVEVVNVWENDSPRDMSCTLRKMHMHCLHHALVEVPKLYWFVCFFLVRPLSSSIQIASDH